MPDYAISPDFLKRYREWANQRYLTTGIAPRPDDLAVLSQAAFEAESEALARNKQLELQERSVNQQDTALAMQADRDKAAARAATVSGITSTGTTAALTYGVGKSLGWWGGAPAVAPGSGLTTGGVATTGGAMIPSTAAAPSGTGFMAGAGPALPGAAITTGAQLAGRAALRSVGVNEEYAQSIPTGPLGGAATAAGKGVESLTGNKTLGKAARWAIDPIGSVVDFVSDIFDFGW